jgi:hypothetical protein
MSSEQMSIMSVELREHEKAWADALFQAVRGVRYGSVEVRIHDGRVVQIERREKLRLDGAGSPPDHRGCGNNQHRRADRRAGGLEATGAEETSE